ncbi:hypothetical protein LQ51_04965 [Micromonospora sp. HK10]|nr:hypothetical protein LQ51_04965 [Micromonospora sp. HK10]
MRQDVTSSLFAGFTLSSLLFLAIVWRSPPPPASANMHPAYDADRLAHESISSFTLLGRFWMLASPWLRSPISPEKLLFFHMHMWFEAHSVSDALETPGASSTPDPTMIADAMTVFTFMQCLPLDLVPASAGIHADRTGPLVVEQVLFVT